MFSNYKFLLVLTIFSVLTLTLFGTAGNIIVLGLGILFVQKKDIRYFPLIVLITAFLSTAYILYIQMFIICLANFSFIKNKKQAKTMVLYSLMVLLFLFFSIKKYIIIDANLGFAITDYSFILALAPFFYGIFLTKNQSKNLNWKNLFYVLIIILILNSLLKLIQFDFVSTRLIFYIIPFLFLQILANFTSRKARVITILSAVFLFFIVDGFTFTLIFTGLLSWLLLYKRFFSSSIVILVTIAITLFIPFYAILNAHEVDYTAYTDISINDIKTVDDLKGKIGMKLFEDRGPIWSSAWASVVTKIKIWPKLEKEKLIIHGKNNIEQEWDYHSHNVYLESLLSLGLVLGVLIILLFLYLNIIAFKAYRIIQLDTFKSVFITVAIISNLVGAMSGIFPLLLDFSFLTLGLLGIIVGLSKTTSKNINLYNLK